LLDCGRNLVLTSTTSFMKRYILPIPFQMAPFGVASGEAYKNILNANGINEGASEFYPDNQIRDNCEVLEAVKYDFLPDDQPEIGRYLRSALSMQANTATKIESIWADCEQLVVIGGDHSVSIGTGAGLSRVTDLSRIGMVWVDAHGDVNTDKTSASKSITGYPLAVATGLGPEALTESFQGNFIKKVVHIGLRDCERQEADNLQSLDSLVFTPYDIDMQGLSKVLSQTSEFLKDCDYIWLSCDIDVLDGIYLAQDETDLPVPAGLTPREVLTIGQYLQKTGKLKVAELVQINQTHSQTPIIAWSSRFIEAIFGLGGYRYGA
jgi:arginase